MKMILFVVGLILALGCGAGTVTFPEVSGVTGNARLAGSAEGLEIRPNDWEDNHIYAFGKFAELGGGQWSIKAEMSFASPHLRQSAGIFVGDGEKEIRLVVGKLILNGSDFNIGLYDAGGHGIKAVLPGFKAGDRIGLELLKDNGKVYGIYRLDGAPPVVIGSLTDEVAGRGDRAGVVFKDSLGSRLKRMQPGMVPNGVAKYYAFKVEQAVDRSVLSGVPRVFMKLKTAAVSPAPALAAVTLLDYPHLKSGQFGLGAKSGCVPMTPGFHKRQEWSLLNAEGDAFGLNTESVWCDVSDYFSTPNFGKMLILSFFTSTRHGFPGSDSGNVDGFELELSFASAPDDKSIVKTIRYGARHYALALLIPPNDGPLAAWGPKIRTYREYTQARLDAALKAGARPFDAPRLIPIGGIAPPEVHSQWCDAPTLEIHSKILALLGQNQGRYTVSQLPKMKWDFWAPDLPRAIDAFLKTRNIPQGDYGVKIGDEPALITLDRLTASPHGLKQFRAYLRKCGENEKTLEVEDFDTVMPIKREDVKTLAQRRLFYHQCFFLQESTWNIYRVFCERFQRINPRAELGTDVHLGGFANQPDYFVEARLKATTRQKHHYGSGETSTRQIYGNFFIADMLRSAAEFGDIRTGMLWFPCRLAAARGVHLTGIAAMIRNLQHVYLYGFGPMAHHGEYFSDDVYKVDAFAAASDLLRAWAKYERYLVFGRRPAVETALVFGRGNAIWSGANLTDAAVAFAHDDAREQASGEVVATEYASGYPAERGMILGTLALNGIRCDVLPTEETGRLKNYRALYIYEPVLERKMGDAVIDWVKKGGVLYLGADAAVRNEYNEPDSLLEHAFGGRAARKVVAGETGRFMVYGGYGEVWRAGTSYTEEDAKGMRVLGTAAAANEKFNVIGLKEELTVPGAEILASYSDGAPAVAVLPLGQGQVILSGIRLGIALAATAEPGFEAQTGAELPPFTLRNTGASAVWRRTLSPAVENLVLAVARRAGVPAHVELPFPGIDSGVFELPDGSGAVVMLGRYTSRDTSKLPVSVELKHQYSRAVSFSGQPVELKRSGNKHSFTVVLDDYEIVELLK